MVTEDLNRTIDTWIDIIQQYSDKELCTQPDANNWSIGQVCMHLINDTNWFIEQLKICLSNNENAEKTKSPFAKSMFANNSFPDEKLSNPANINIPQPPSKEVLLQLFVQLKNDMNHAAIKIESSRSKGKAKHPGFNYFSAIEWLQFAEMHLRHHLKQKERIDAFLAAEKQAGL